MKREDHILSRPFVVADVPARGYDIAVEANAEERARIAAEFELPEVMSLKGTYHLTATKRGVRVEGQVEANIRQICVVSLEPFEAKIEEKVDLLYAQEPARHKSEELRGEITVSLDEEDPPEPIIDGKIDLGAVTLEFLVLGLDPYPRKPGVELVVEKTEEKPPSPFSVLATYGQKDTGRK
jgi:hypothetical protein